MSVEKPKPKMLRKLFSYDPDTGRLAWAVRRGSRGAGVDAGSKDSRGRIRVEINKRSYAAHQIAFAIHHDRWAADQVDHINGDKIDNRIANLREATNAENSRNRRRAPGASGVRGVTLHRGRYIARVMVDGKSINLGSFDSASQASAAYESAIVEHHGRFACPM